jgi:hypothetical protein
MTTERNQKKTRTDAVPTPTPVSTVLGEQEDWRPGDPSPTYVVVRQAYGTDHRVSDREYKTENDPMAVIERDFWARVIKFHPDGTSTNIVKFDKRKHRIW